MTNPLPSKSLTRHPTGPQAAAPAGPRTAVGDSKGVAEGVPTAVLPDRQTADGRYPVAWLTICAPYGATPTASSRCACGWERRAFGRRRVLALIIEHTDHRDACPLRTPREGRAAA
ncbi:hypothetical protein J8N05_15170 [Streptomyces sp. BH-SS-21]|uniref:Uncharacterized protein n=1 Tax=Streptomyces liliiviolaceus TaxID=2823109 RepID=A0A940XSV3_9ACTN|nr:hypothetical protein [Streptomyces liliiviolaceus]MBQ0849541.1 hypothetical protein [Streptomyces liliiviolaceus]